MHACTCTMATVRQRSLLLLSFVTVLLSLGVCSYASSRTLQVSIGPEKDPITVPFDPRLAINSNDIDASDARVKKQSSDCQQPEQVSTALQQHHRRAYVMTALKVGLLVV